MPTQSEKAETFRSLHRRGAAFILANVWDTGSARMFAALGAPALATTSAGFAYREGERDWPGTISRDRAMAHCREIAAATDLPVSGDLEDGFGAEPETVAATIRYAATAGLVGCTIEDTTGDEAQPIHEFGDAVARIEAAVAAARSLPFPFMLTARAENFLHGRPDLDDTIARLKAFEAAGADVLYAPGLPDLDAVRAVCDAVSAPVNVLPGGALRSAGRSALAEAGAARISLGSALARVSIGAAVRAGREILGEGSFESFGDALGFGEIEELLAGGAPGT